MAEDNLQTRCPACQTVFAVDSDVLKQAGGRVRCGECLHIFDALANADEDIPVLLSKPSPVVDDIIDIGSSEADAGEAVIDFADTFLPTEFAAADATNESSVAEDALADVFSDSEPRDAAALDLDIGAPTTDTPDDATRLLSDTTPDDIASDALDLDFDSVSAPADNALDFDLDDGLADALAGAENGAEVAPTDALDLDFSVDAIPSDDAPAIDPVSEALLVTDSDQAANHLDNDVADNITSDESADESVIDMPVGEDRPEPVADVSAPLEADPEGYEPNQDDLPVADLEPEFMDVSADESGVEIDMQDLTAAFGGDTPADDDSSQDEPVEETADTAEPPAIDDGLRDGTGRFLFSDDTPPEELEAELQALANDDSAPRTPTAVSEPPAVALELGQPDSAQADPESLIQTLSGEDWDDLLDELGDESDVSDSPALDFELVEDDTSASSVDLDLTRADDALTAADEDSAENVASPAAAIDADAMALAENDMDDAVELAAPTDDDSHADALPPDRAIAETERPVEAPAPLAAAEDDDKTTFLATEADGHDADGDKTAFLGSGASARDDQMAFLTSGPSNESSDDEIFDINALTNMLRASEVFLDDDDEPEAPAALPEEQREILLKEDLDGDVGAPADDAQSDDGDLAADDDRTALMTPSDDMARTDAPEEQQIIEEIVLSSDEPPAIQETPEDMFAQSMIMAVPEAPRRKGLWSALSVLLVIALGGQLVHQYRGQLLTMDPWGAYLGKAYAVLGLDAEPVWDINALCVQRSGSTLTERTLDIETLFQNQTQGPVPLPTIKVDITDNFDDVIATALVGPADYLPNDQPTASMLAAAARQTAYLSLDFAESRADKFELSLCYDGDGGTLRCGAAICGNGR
ncbi:MAG: DUF3426 domain-containing protein [Pseudomonadota bacterium]